MAAQRNVDGFGPDGNTCASRMSVAFNRARLIVSSRVGPRETPGTADGTRIIFAVAAFRHYLIATLGEPRADKLTPFDSDFAGKRGIIAVSVNLRNATGHIGLLNRAVYREPDYDCYATYVNASEPTRRTLRGGFRDLR